MPWPVLAWTVLENGARRPLLLEGAGDVSSRDLPEALRSAMRVDALAGTVEWTGDRGWIRAAIGESVAVKNGRRLTLPRNVRCLESVVVFPEEILKILPDIFSFVDAASGEEGDVLTIRDKSPTLTEPSPEIRPVESPAAVQPDPAAVPPARVIRTIVIDPGHGGGDPGAKGRAGSVEKDITLAIGLSLARLIQERDPSMSVILTRSRDEFVSLPDRAKIANTRKGDLFVSIHANSVRRNAAAEGFEVYHLDVDGANDDARAVAAFENAEPQLQNGLKGPRGSANPAVDQILGALLQMQYINSSMELSKYTADGLTAALEGASKFRGSKGAFFYVLKDVMAPAILIEVGFLTNDWEASFLQKPWYQRKIAEGIVQGVLNFKRAEETRLNPNGAAVPPAPVEP